ncbi:MAG: flagellar hook-associated protein FlgK [Pseudomonadota bacterium]
MSISTALVNAQSGLSASARGVEVVSNNVSNALTPGYIRREVVLSSLSLEGASGGVRVTEVARQTNPVATADRRAADSQLSADSTEANAYARILSAVGEPGDAFGLVSRLDQFDTALSRAVTSPESLSAMESVVSSARSLSGTLRAVTEVTAAVRMDADAGISRQVRSLNAAMQDVVRLNGEIRTRAAAGADVNALIDARDRALDSISQSIPIRVVRREGDQIAVFTQGGAALVDGKAATLEFAATPTIAPGMTVADGSLSRLIYNGVQVSPETGLFDGGALAADFRLRDEIAPSIQADLDGLAADLIDRMVVADPTVAIGGVGLFTDDGGALVSTDVTGLAGRLSVNTAVMSGSGGDPFALRDGLNATSPRPSGDPTLLLAMRDALEERTVAPPGASDPRTLSFTARIASVAGTIATSADNADQALAYTTAKAADLLTEEQRLTGVDTDQELQTLLALEEAYAANARVLSVADDLVKLLLEI